MNTDIPGTTHSPTPFSPILFLILLVPLALLASCRAEDGIEGGIDGGGGGPATWTQVDAAISDTGCRGCHPAIVQPTLDFASLVGVNEPLACNGGADILVVASDSSTSALYLTLTGGRSGSCDMSGNSTGTLNSFVQSWIDDGAQNN